jgi:hypothetical protein
MLWARKHSLAQELLAFALSGSGELARCGRVRRVILV